MVNDHLAERAEQRPVITFTASKAVEFLDYSCTLHGNSIYITETDKGGAERSTLVDDNIDGNFELD